MTASGGPPRRDGPPSRRVAAGVGAGVLVAWWLLPLLPVVVWSAADRWRYPALWPQQWGTTGWAAAWHDGAGPAVLRSAALGLAVAALATPLGALAGVGLAHPGRDVRAARSRAKVVWAAAIALPVAVPPFVTVLGLTTLALRWRIPATAALVAVLTGAALPYTTWVMHARWVGYDSGPEQAARTLGATRTTVILRVRLPELAPAVALAAFLAFLVAWGDYTATLVLGGGQLRSLQQLLGTAASGSGTEPATAALAVLTVIPALLLLAVVTRLQRSRGTP